MTHTYDPRFLDLLEARALPEWSGEVWRQVLGGSDPRRPNQRGARWNPPGVEALYCSLERATAVAEIDHLLSLQPVPVLKPRSTVQLAVRLTRVVDLLDGAWLEGLEFDRLDIVGEQYESPQLVGRAVAWLGCAGLLVPSARRDGANLVIFTNQMSADDYVELVD